ncbi:hypothetical protein M0R45_021772 [Rubus argutus]|uniref:B-like cyclin n=1 Tax=Rubus argutus TaxID=59490 RepID=A0AAW1XFU9_RUBAR
MQMPLRARLIDFLIQSAQRLQLPPTEKYTALSIFAHRFYPRFLSKLEQGTDMGNWLLQPLRESNLQLFSLVSLWISNKIHSSPALSVKIFKSLGDKSINEQHFTIRDYSEAEVVLMQVVSFEICVENIAFVYFEELLLQFKGVAKVGELVNFEAGMDIMDLLYEKEETTMLYANPHSLAASVLVASYIITVPKQTFEFPILPWVKFVTGCEEEDIVEMVADILKHVFHLSC